MSHHLSSPDAHDYTRWQISNLLDEYRDQPPDALAKLVAHDVNNRMSIIVGYSELLRQNLQRADALDEDCRIMLELILHAAAQVRTVQEAFVAIQAPPPPPNPDDEALIT